MFLDAFAISKTQNCRSCLGKALSQSLSQPRRQQELAFAVLGAKCLYANWPSSILEMHYNNTGIDVNEYIEIHQSSNTGFGGLANKLLFYDQNNEHSDEWIIPLY